MVGEGDWFRVDGYDLEVDRGMGSGTRVGQEY